MHSLSTFLLAALLVNCWLASEAFRIGAFNIQTFGPTKYNNATLMNHIVSIIQRYDVVLIQEIRDASGVVIPGLLQQLKNTGDSWSVENSTRLGRSSYKEQYAYYYRPNVLKKISTYQYDDGVDDYTDAFAREPFGILFRPNCAYATWRFGLLGVHIAPNDAVEEIDSLVDVVNDAKQVWNTESVMIIGDLNADCSYVNSAEMASLALRQDPSYQWLIGDEVDTTVSSTNCAYDRMIVSGAEFQELVDSTTAQEYRFDTDLGLDYALARKVSDHYPVEVTISPQDG